MKLKLGLAVAAFAVAATGIAVANEDIIGLRRQVMKTNGQAAKVAVGMLKGEIAFDAEVAAAAMNQIADDLTVFPAYFPEGTETGDTKAGDKIWSDPDGFKAAAKTAEDAAKAAAAAAADGPEAFGTAFGAVGKACGGCHEVYRKS